MRANRKTGSRPEARLRSALHARGLRFRKNLRLSTPTIRVVPDIVFTRARVTIFVDGCYWHSCPEHGTAPASNISYWQTKLAGNVARDRRVDSALRIEGWSVVRIWEHDVVHDVAAVVQHVEPHVTGGAITCAPRLP